MEKIKTLQECKTAVANKYGYQQWINVSFYEIDERDQITTPPYAKDRLIDEVAELYASQYKELNAELTRKLDFYRDQTQKVRDYVNNRTDIGLPNQNIFEAVMDKFKEKDELNAELLEALTHLTANVGVMRAVHDAGKDSLLHEVYEKAKDLITKAEQS